MTDIAKHVLLKGTAVLIAVLAMSSPTLAAIAAAALDRFSLQGFRSWHVGLLTKMVGRPPEP